MSVINSVNNVNNLRNTVNTVRPFAGGLPPVHREFTA